MIDIMNNKIISIDDNGNIIELDNNFSELCKGMEKILGDDLILDENLIEPVEDIYYYLVEKIYELPTYAWDAEFKDGPKQKLNSAFNKLIHNKILWKTQEPYWNNYFSDAKNLRQSNGKFLV